MPQITIATLNIAAGAKERVRKLIDQWFAHHVYDIYVITETSDGPGTALLLSEFRNAGWEIFQRSGEFGDRGVAIASRIGGTLSNELPQGDPAPGRSLILYTDTIPRIELIGMYVPNRGNDWNKTDRKRKFLACWQAYCGSIPAPGMHRILAGDLNVVPQDQRPFFLPQEQFEYKWFLNLTGPAGLQDAAVKYGKGHESTWVAHNGEGYTYDHILPASSLADRIISFQYDHSTRKDRILTDHTALVLTLQLDIVKHRCVRRVGEPAQMGLF